MSGWAAVMRSGAGLRGALAVLLLLLAAALLVACGRSMERRSEPQGAADLSSSAAGDEGPAKGARAAPPADVGVDLGVAVVRAGPGHYATRVEHASQRAPRAGTVASMVLELEAGGEALACRTERSTAGGAQLGLAGRWGRLGSWVDVELAPSDRACAARADGDAVTLADDPLHLRCLAVEPDDRPAAFEERALACTPLDELVEVDPWSAPAALPHGPWILLADGPGLHVRAEERPGALLLEIGRATEPVTRAALHDLHD